jgi:hypothetical protein
MTTPARTFTATLQKSPTRAAGPASQMPDSAEYFGIGAWSAPAAESTAYRSAGPSWPPATAPASSPSGGRTRTDRQQAGDRVTVHPGERLSPTPRRSTR